MPSHVTSFNQFECFISQFYRYAASILVDYLPEEVTLWRLEKGLETLFTHDLPSPIDKRMKETGHSLELANSWFAGVQKHLTSVGDYASVPNVKIFHMDENFSQNLFFVRSYL